MSEVRPLEDLFSDLISCATEQQREEYLTSACGSDRGLRKKLENLLAAHERADSFLGDDGADLVAGESDGHQLGTQIGPYKLREQIGEGGMGVVFVAEQTEPVQRKVALKIIKPGMDTQQVIARFEAERQSLALMDHPHIAKVHDGGTTNTGRPYFVMELVQGLPITEYCDRHQLAKEQRLQLFLLVCQAVQHAHQRGMIHRDLKPSNILVSKIDDAAVPKVIDFGVAKAISGKLTDQTVYTQHAQMIGTPLYMSPEQAELGVVDVDIRSDVYSLGVLLYETLAGYTPFDSDTLQRVGFDEMRRIIKEDEPQKPSARVSTLKAEQLSTISECRKCDPRKLAASLAGELDWIVMKSLEKDRNRRYQSASELASDVERFLTNRPIVARPPSVLYRARKYAQRHAARLIPAAAVAAVMLVGLAIAVATAFRERAEKAQALHDTARMLYVTQMQQAAAAWERNDYGELESLLRRTTPRPDRHQPDFRDWEWGFLRNQARRPFIKIPDIAVSQAAWRPGRLEIAVCSDAVQGDVSVDLLSVGSGAPTQRIANLADMAGVSGVRWSRDGERIAIGDREGRVVVLVVKTGERLFDRSAFDDGKKRYVWAFDLTPSGDRIAVARRSGLCRLWSVDDQTLLFEANAKENVSCVAFSPDGNSIVIASKYGWFHLFDVEQETSEQEYERVDMGSDNQIAWSPKGDRFAVTSDSGVAIYNPEEPAPIAMLPHRQAKIVCWITANTLASAGADYAVRLWDVTNRIETRSLFFDTETTRFFGASDDESMLAIRTRGRLRIVDVAETGEIHRLASPEKQVKRGNVAIRWSPSGRLLAAAGNDWLSSGTHRPKTRVYDLQGGLVFEHNVAVHPQIAWDGDDRLCITDHYGALHNIDIKRRRLTNARELASVDEDVGAMIAINLNRNVYAFCERHPRSENNLDLQIRELNSSQTMDTIDLSQTNRRQMRWSPDHRYLAVVYLSETAEGDRLGVLVYDVQLREHHRRELDDVSGKPMVVTWDPTSSQFVVGLYDGTVHLIEADSLGDRAQLTGHRGPVWATACSPDGARVATGSDDGAIRIWDAVQGDLVALYHLPNKSEVLSVDWSPDGRTLAVGAGDGAIYLLDGG